jgi:hypothetical protein
MGDTWWVIIICPCVNVFSMGGVTEADVGFPTVQILIWTNHKLKVQYNLLPGPINMAQTSLNKCDICEEAISKVFCYECQHFLCQTCQTWHEKFPSTRRHTVADSSHIDRSAFNTKFICEKHNQEYLHYCQNCTCLTCAICVTSNHRNH